MCHIAEPHEMPVDSDGNRADIIGDPNARWNRMNMGGLFEMYVNAASRDVGKRVRQMVGIQQGDTMAKDKLEELMIVRPDDFNKAWDYLVSYYKVVAPKMYQWYSGDVQDDEKLSHLSVVVEDHIYLYVPPEHSPESVEMVKEVEKKFRPTYGPVTYTGYSGNQVVTKNPVRIASMYFLMLEKIGNEKSAVDSARVQLFGVLARLTRSTKHSEPIRSQPVKMVGEMEWRIVASHAGPEAIAEVMDRNNNPQTHKLIVRELFATNKPTNVANLIDRKYHPYGGSKPLQNVNHIGMIAGFEFAYNNTFSKRGGYRPPRYTAKQHAKALNQ